MRQLTDDAQVVTDDYCFDGWGKLTSSTGSTANSQLYKGEYLAYRKDPDAGPELQYSTHHRNYNPQTGVFTAAAPAKDDLNLYRYVKNNPVNKSDPSGLQEEECAKEPQQPIEFTKAPLEDFAAKMLGSKELGNAFIKFQGTSAGDRLVDLMTWGWQIRIEGFHFRSTIDKPYHVDAPKHELQIYKGSSTYTGGEYGGSESQTLYDTRTLCENIKLAIYDNRVTEGNRDSGPESTLFAGVSAFADHPNIGIIVGTIEVVGGVALIAGSGGSAIPIIIGGYSALRGLENAGTSTYESVTGKEARAPSHQLADMATGDQETTDRIFFWTDIGLAVVDLANGARLYLKTVKAAKSTATEAVKVGDAALSSAADAGKVVDVVPSSSGTLVDETTDALKNADATASSSATPPSGTASPPPEPTIPNSVAPLDAPPAASPPNEILDSPSANPSTTKLDDGNVAPSNSGAAGEIAGQINRPGQESSGSGIGRSNPTSRATA